MIGLGVLFVLLISWVYIKWPPMIFELIIIAFGYGLLMPLIVSAWVYDLVGLLQLPLVKCFGQQDDRIEEIVNINAGFDETSFYN